MLKIEEIHELIKLIDDSTIDEFTYENEGAKIKLKKNKEVVQQVAAQAPVAPVQAAPAQQAPTAQAPAQTEAPVQEAAASENLHKITSPMVGTFYASSSPEADPYVTTGSKVKENTVVCIVEAMKLFNEIEAEVKGEIVEVLAENGQLVEFGQPLFLVKAE
ncbi:acetyl-CoA carboxylase biotin carboxyl carrier protein [Bacillus safensis]|uniref:acetyl-CoA carboxylase biotin carboxyl carrier protein n=1 Tax=Bacillus safensis TaxID=561879 RepID=UPI001B3A17FE|nr:acetyl-CoA carboxylase biotin carboxyl carrier protein [Bacillus safensis]MBQ4840532.1 acetyl-CoA carboxylase biotin carboxyl carrier protein [Bacillus safensis]MBQ4872360.1 acetyl-CoA carboxylase biotin carboxyl carrier protein [Bacillus safensis]MBQ4885986.1 acetyl-CoA carboxylase biotin carboxyl carrier protein [Bacillus safensis]